jgi:hypothetical protein
MLFRLDGRQVRFEASCAASFVDGDVVRVAGSTQSGIFKALAYHNDTTGASGDAGLARHGVLAIFLAGFAFLTKSMWGASLSASLHAENLRSYGASSTAGVPDLVFFALSAGAAYTLYRAIRILLAKLAIKA